MADIYRRRDINRPFEEAEVDHNWDELDRRTRVNDEDYDSLEKVVVRVKNLESESGMPDLGRGLIIDQQERLTLDLESSTLPSISISPNWTIYDKNGKTENPETNKIGESTSANLIADIGSKVYLSATWKWNTPTPGQSAPTATSGAFGSALPPANTDSAVLTDNDVTANKTYTQTITKPKSGLIVSNNQVNFASGSDSKNDIIKVEFFGRGGVIISTAETLTAGAIETAINNGDFWKTKAQTLANITAGIPEYTYIVYDASLPALSSIKVNGFENLTAFNSPIIQTITNKAGVSRTVRIYKSNAKGAFTNNTLILS